MSIQAGEDRIAAAFVTTYVADDGFPQAKATISPGSWVSWSALELHSTQGERHDTQMDIAGIARLSSAA